MVAAAFVLGLAACGGDDGNGGGDSAQAPENGGSEQPLSDEQLGKNDPQGGEDRGKTSGSKLKLENTEPAPRLTDRQRKQLEAAPKPKVDPKVLERQIYESSRFFCKEAGIERMRSEYGVESSDPKAIAREAARRNYDRGGAEAVYSGCLAGLTGK